MAEENLDYILALSLQEEFDRDSTPASFQQLKAPLPVHNGGKEYDPQSIVDRSWELTDPNPNIHDLFVRFDQMFFKGTLVSHGVAVSWSNRMTLCAGVCSYQGREGFCSIRLSQPLLKLRPRRDLVQTMLHEMIHAFLFVTYNNTDRDGHGPNFQYHMKRINSLTGTKITIYHNFRDEVQVYKQHWWKCNGPCQRRPPYFGLVKRAMNRTPSHRDPWWTEHQRTCGGTYSKIKEPEGYVKKGEGKSKGHVLGGESSRGKNARTQHSNSTSKKKVKVHVSSDANMKIDEMFPKDENKRKTWVEPHKDSDSQATQSSGSMRNKILAAAEKRLAKGNSRGTAPVKRSLSQGSEDNLPKKTKVETRKSILSSRTSPVLDLCKTDTHSIQQPSPPTVIDLCDDNFEQLSPSVNDNSLNSPGTLPQASSQPSSIFIDDSYKESNSTQEQGSNDFKMSGKELLSTGKSDTVSDSSEMIVIDDAEVVRDPMLDESGFKTCPVCGLNGIPAVIINAHVAFCLDEENWD